MAFSFDSQTPAWYAQLRGGSPMARHMATTAAEFDADALARRKAAMQGMKMGLDRVPVADEDFMGPPTQEQQMGAVYRKWLAGKGGAKTRHADMAGGVAPPTGDLAGLESQDFRGMVRDSRMHENSEDQPEDGPMMELRQKMQQRPSFAEMYKRHMMTGSSRRTHGY